MIRSVESVVNFNSPILRSPNAYIDQLNYLASIEGTGTVQACYILNVPGANLSRENEIFTIKTMYLIFKELNSELFEFENEMHPRPDKTYDVNKMLPFTGWAHYHNIKSCRDIEDAWKQNIEAVNYVLHSTNPGKSTISKFLLNHADLIKSFDKFIKKFGVNLGLIGGTTIY